MKTAKKFDCVKMKDEAQLRRAEQLRDLSLQQRLEFYRRAHEALVRRQAELRSNGGGPGTPGFHPGGGPGGPGSPGDEDAAGGPRKGPSAGQDDVIDAEYEVKK